MTAQVKIEKVSNILANIATQSIEEAQRYAEGNIQAIKEAQNLIQEFVRANLPKPKSAINLLRYNDTSEYKNGEYLRPALAGVYHSEEDKVAIACDSHIIILSKKEYDEQYAHKVVTKKGEVLEEGRDFKYPNYRAILPQQADMNVEGGYQRADLEALQELIPTATAKRKLDRNAKIAIGIPGTGAYIKYEYAKTLEGLEGSLYVKDERRMIYFENENYKIGIMPLYQPTEEEFTIVK